MVGSVGMSLAELGWKSRQLMRRHIGLFGDTPLPFVWKRGCILDGLDSDSVAGIVEVTFRVPAWEDHGLADAIFIHSSGPDFVVAFLGE